jgi:hypothetical protein
MVQKRLALMSDFSGKAVIDFLPGNSPYNTPSTPTSNYNYGKLTVNFGLWREGGVQIQRFSEPLHRAHPGVG